MGRTRCNALVAALLLVLVPSGRAQDREWDGFINSARQALELNEFEQAERLLLRARNRSREFSTDDPRRVVALMELAKLHLGRGDYARPEQLYREADPIARVAWGAESQEYAALLNDIGRYYHLRIKFDEAERFYRQAFATRVSLLGQEHADVAGSINNLAVLYENQVLYTRAETYYRTALEIREKALTDQHEDTVETLEHFARLLHKLSRPDEAAPLEERARTFRIDQLGVAAAADLGPLAVGDEVQPPLLLERGEPTYTDEARIAGHEGSVLLQVDIDTDGRARNITLLRPLGLGLDARAFESVSQWLFRPARAGGRAVAARIRLEISFRLM